jgi:hypothetical protein
MRLAPLAALLTVLPRLAFPADDAAVLVQKVLAAYGGRAALERAQIVRQEGTVTSVMHAGPGQLVRLVKAPGSLRVEIRYPGEPAEVRVVHYGFGTRGGLEVRGPMHGAMALQAARLALPLSLAAKDAPLSDRGTVERDGKALRVLALRLPGDLELAVEVDPASGRILRSSGSMPGPGERIAFATEYSDFRKVAGVLFPFHEENWARGHHTGATSLARVEVLAEPPAGAFDESI